MIFVLQAHRSSCSQQGPTWPCLLSSPTATATQQHQATASRHSPASVTACEQPEYPHHHHHHHTHLDLTRHLPSICPSLCVPHQLPMVFYSQRATSKQQPTLVLSTIFLLCRPVTRENVQLHRRDLLLFLLFEKKLDHVCLFFTFHIYDYLFRFVLFVFMLMSCFFFYWFVQKWTC